MNDAHPARRGRQGAIAWSIAGLVAAMTGLSFAAVPLYKEFCQRTGYGGATQVAEKPSATRGTRLMTVRFDTNISAGLPWRLTPETPAVTVQTGETKTVFFKATNLSDRPTAGVAGYNVSPDQSGSYFNKIACFCFNEERLGPGETQEWPVVFYLDPALEADETMRGVSSVTLSYVLYPARENQTAATATRKF